MNKKKLAFLLALLLLVTIFAGCDDLLAQFGLARIDSDSNGGGSSTSALADPVPVVLFLPNDNVDSFVTKTVMTDGTAQDIVALLVSEAALPPDAALLQFEIISDIGATADMNDAYRQAVANTGTAGEYIGLGCVVNTLLTFYMLEEITITIEGQTLETGHNIYDYPLRFFENQDGSYAPPPPSSSDYGASSHASLYDALGDFPNPSAVAYIWNVLNGRRVSYSDNGQYFIEFLTSNGHYYFNFGIVDSGYGRTGEYVSGTKVSNSSDIICYILFAGKAPNELDDGWPEETLAVTLQLSDWVRSYMFYVKIEGFNDNKAIAFQ